MNQAYRVQLLVLGLAGGLLAAPSFVRLSGMVNRAGGGPLTGVSLSLRSAPSITTVSAAAGKFQLMAGASGVVRSLHSSVAFRVSGSELQIVAQEGAPRGRIEVFSATGQVLLSREFQAGVGSADRIASQVFTQGLNVVRLDVGGQKSFCSVLRMDGAMYLKESSTNSVAGVALVSGRAAAVVDTLVARKTGYKDKLLPIDSYVDSNLVIALDSSTGCTPPKAGTSKSNPLFTDVYTADPGVMVDNCTFYIQAGHDQGTRGFDLREWHLLKSTDMVTWTRSTPMTLKVFAWTNANAWAGQMIKARNGKYYWYVPINDIKFSQDRMAIGVAVADSPEGPWKDALGKPLVSDSVEMTTWNITNIDQTPHTIDPTVFIDDDGQAYLQYGGFWTMVSVKLNPDMISLGSKLVKSTPLDYFESPYLIKRNGLYYQIYARGAANPTTIDYATSTNPQGPWTWRGQILGKMPKVTGQDETTNHAGVAEFAGQWYIVYHVSNGPNGGGTYRRMVAIDKLFFNPDGTIQPVTPSAALTF